MALDSLNLPDPLVGRATTTCDLLNVSCSVKKLCVEIEIRLTLLLSVMLFWSNFSLAVSMTAVVHFWTIFIILNSAKRLPLSDFYVA